MHHANYKAYIKAKAQDSDESRAEAIAGLRRLYNYLVLVEDEFSNLEEYMTKPGAHAWDVLHELMGDIGSVVANWSDDV